MQRQMVQHRNQNYGNIVAISKQCGPVPPICCAARAINQVLLNLLKNAAAAGVDEIRTFVAGDPAVVELADNGVGILTEKLERIFDFDFDRSGNTMKMGYMLATSYSVAEQHGASCVSTVGLSAG